MAKRIVYFMLILVLAIIGITGYFLLFNKPTKEMQNPTENIIPGFIIPGLDGVYLACSNPIPPPSPITATSGFAVYNVSGFNDLVLAPGHEGNISYEIKKENSSLLMYNSFYVMFYHRIDPQTISYTSPGIDVSFEPKGSLNNVTASVTAMVSAESNATEGTYWLSLAKGLCSGGPLLLLTIGNSPYSGELENLSWLPSS